jgi:integrase
VRKDGQRIDRLATQRKWSARTWNTYFKYLSGFFNWAIGAETFGIERNPCRRNTAFKIDKKAENKKRERRVPEVAEEKMIEFCLGRLDVRLARTGGGRYFVSGRTMLRRLYAAIDSGVRAGEMLEIKLKMVVWDVQYTLDNGTTLDAIKIVLPPEITKGGKTTGEDEVSWVMTPRLVAVLKERRFIGKEGYLFGDERGGRVRNFNKSWHDLYTEAGLVPGMKDGEHCWHDLRHEFASYLVENGATGDEVMKLCRHRDYETTQLYLKARDSRLAERAALMANRKMANAGGFRQDSD